MKEADLWHWPCSVLKLSDYLTQETLRISSIDLLKRMLKFHFSLKLLCDNISNKKKKSITIVLSCMDPTVCIYPHFLILFIFSVSLSLSVCPLWRRSHGAPQGWAQRTDKHSTHGDPGHPSQNKQQEDVYLCPFHWPWPLLWVWAPPCLLPQHCLCSSAQSPLHYYKHHTLQTSAAKFPAQCVRCVQGVFSDEID